MDVVATQGRSRHPNTLATTAFWTDLFIEASRLVAEYLVSKEILPPNALSGKWQNRDWKNQVVDFMQIPMDGRTSGHSRLGTAATNVGPRRRYYDEYNSIGSKNSMIGMRKLDLPKIMVQIGTHNL
ncbi:putative protein-like [Forsythia ovata]|uniref:Uncharacterized protein n=1 Tax=Forsythia ovata TaxID=205694 RepID=A0ABD1UB57_9LAMI